MPSDGATRSSVIQKVQNRNNIADMYLRRQMDEFKKHLTLKVLTIEMERLEWHTFLKDLRKCDSDDLKEFVPLLIDELGEEEYSGRVRKLKTRFRDLFHAMELGMKEEKIHMDYVKIREDGEKAQKNHRRVKSEFARRARPPPPADTERNSSPTKAQSRADNVNGKAGGGKMERVSGFITSMPSPGIDHAVQSNRMQGDSQGDQQPTPRPYGAPRPFFPVMKKREEPEVATVRPRKGRGDGDDDDDEGEFGSELDFDDDDDDDIGVDGAWGRKKRDAMRATGEKNTKKMRRCRRPRKPRKPLETRIEEFYVRIDSLRCEPHNAPKTVSLPPIGAY